MNKSLKLFDFGYLIALGLLSSSGCRLQFIDYLLMVRLHLDEVFVEMILHEKILLDSVVQVLNLSLLFG